MLPTPAEVDGTGILTVTPSQHGQSTRYPPKVRKPVERYGQSANAARASANLPTTVEEALRTEETAEWKSAIDAEVASLFENDTCVVFERPDDADILDSRMVLSPKLKEDGWVT